VSAGRRGILKGRPEGVAPLLAIEAHALTKTYGRAVRALDGLSFAVEEGIVFGLLGPNGAGKSTAVRILATLSRPDSGSARVAGVDVLADPGAARRRLGYVAQASGVDLEATGRENLELQGRLFGLGGAALRARVDELLAVLGLEDAADRLVRTYSGGMRRRIDIAASLITVPEILFLDEPTTGLDPRGRNQVWDLVRRIAGEGTTVLLTTQYLDEADRLAERLAVIDHGRVIAEGTSRELKASVGANAVHVRLADANHGDAARAAIARVLGNGVMPGSDVQVIAARLTSTAQAAEVLAALTQADVEVAEFSVGTPSLDEVFLALTGKTSEQPVAEGEAKR
jgi:ABC-2 type transport system ATP-binding protein